jgi:hypothetical protein
MIERVICPTDFSQQSDSVIATINNGSSFKLTYRFFPINKPGAKINLNSFDLKATYWVYGYENIQLEFNKLSISDQSCIIDPFNSVVKFIFNNYSLYPGKLYFDLTFRLADPCSPYGYTEDKLTGFTGIILK